MGRLISKSFAGLAIVLLASGVAGCNAFGILGEDDENEVRVTVVALAANSLDADDGHTYEVTAATEFEGYTGFADVAVGHVVEIEWESLGNGNRRALEIESGDHDDSGDDEG